MYSEISLPGDGSLPFADNMVTPAWDKFPNAKDKFDGLVEDIVKFIDQGGFNYIKSITIQGSADSARPTEDVPSGYSVLDHPDGIYGRKTGDKERNQYLVDTRAKQYALAIINVIKERTKKDLSSKFKDKKGLNYFGSEGKERGPEFKSITLNIDADDIPVKKGKKGGKRSVEFVLNDKQITEIAQKSKNGRVSLSIKGFSADWYRKNYNDSQGNTHSDTPTVVIKLNGEVKYNKKP